MILIYKFLTSLFFPVFILLIFLRKILKKEDHNRYKEKIFPSNFRAKKKSGNRLIWFHASSVGELKSILPIIKDINKKNKNLEFLITTVTLSSGNLASTEIKNYNNIYHRFFPLDVTFLVNNFLDTWSPDSVFFIDSEIWPNFILQIKKREIPLAILNARITKKTFKRWNLFPKTAKKIFNKFDLCLTSNLETKKYLLEFKAQNIFFKGNLKLINAIENKKDVCKNKDFLTKNRFWVAASTHPGEERLCLEVHKVLKKKFTNIITVIIPRHIYRANNIKKISDSLGLNSKIHELNDEMTNENEIFIVNHYGSLNQYFNYAKSVFMGKSMLKSLQEVGGQNPIDPARLGCKIYHGKYVYNFNEIYELLEKNNISKTISNIDELVQYLSFDLKTVEKDRNNFDTIINNLGNKTLDEVMKSINKFLFNVSN